MPDVTIGQQQLLEEARAELAAVESALIELGTSKAQATKSSAEFTAWRQDHDAKVAERERLSILTETLARELASAEAADQADAVRKRHAEKLTENEKLARRIRSEMPRLQAAMLQLVRDVASSMIEDAEINSNLPDDLDQLVSADQMARSRPSLPRQEVGRERLWLWTRKDNGVVVDAGRVKVLGEGKGVIEGNDARRGAIPCTTKLFEEVSFHPPEPAQRARPLWQMTLVDAEGPGVLFDGSEMRQPRELLAALDRAARAREPRERPIQTEIVPIGSKPAEES